MPINADVGQNWDPTTLPSRSRSGGNTLGSQFRFWIKGLKLGGQGDLVNWDFKSQKEPSQCRALSWSSRAILLIPVPELDASGIISFVRICTVFVRYLYGICTVFVRCLNGFWTGFERVLWLCMGFVWDLSGICLDMHGICLGFEQELYGVCVSTDAIHSYLL